MTPFNRDPFEDHFDKFDKQFNRTFGIAAVLGVLWMLFWIGVVVTLLVLLWRNFA